MTRLHRLLVAVIAVAALLSAGSTAATAAESDGCNGTLVSLRAEGGQLDSAQVPGVNASADVPLVIDPGGTISWFGETTVILTNATWSVSAFGLPLLSGEAPNPDGAINREGLLALSTLSGPATWLFTGGMIVPVSGSISSPNGDCTATAYVTVNGSPTSSPFFLAGLVALLLGGVVLAFVVATTRDLPAADFLASGYVDDEYGVDTDRHPVIALFGGLLIGVGVAVLLFVFGVLAVSWGWLLGSAALFGLLSVVGAYVVPARKPSEA